MSSLELPEIKILKAKIHNISRPELFAAFTEGALFTPNVDFLMLMENDPEFLDLFHQAEFRVCDSQILMWAGRFLGTPFKEKISGSDFMFEFCEHHKNDPRYSMFFFGAADGVADIARERINSRLGCNFVVGAYAPPMGFENDPVEVERARQIIRDSGAGSVAVALGAPKQERWIIENRPFLPNVRCYMGIGGTLSFEAGAVHRSPKWMSDVGMEWAWRLAKEPRRLWRRYLVDDLPFFKLLIRQKLAQGRAALE